MGRDVSPAEIQTGDLPNTSQKHYPMSQHDVNKCALIVRDSCYGLTDVKKDCWSHDHSVTRSRANWYYKDYTFRVRLEITRKQVSKQASYQPEVINIILLEKMEIYTCTIHCRGILSPTDTEVVSPAKLN